MKKDRPAVWNERGGATSVDAPHDAKLSHPVGTGIGAAAGGAAAGVAVGSVAGPIGTAVGAAAGALAGAVAGREAAARSDPEAEDDFWRQRHESRPYLKAGASYEDYRPAYRYGIEACRRYGACDVDRVESELAAGWDEARGGSPLGWHDARPAVQDAWRHASDAMAHERRSATRRTR